MKIFISAYACEPEKGSEPGIGWNVVNELARSHEVHVLTRANNREAIETALAGRQDDVPVFHYYDLPRWAMFWKKKRRGYRFYYYLWQYGAFVQYRNWVNSANFDIVQHLTFANFAMPSLFMTCRATTVYGPIGYINVPDGVMQSLPPRIRRVERLRQWVMRLMVHLEPARAVTTAAADWLIEYAENPHPCFPARYRYKVLHHSQTGINTGEPEYRLIREPVGDGKVHLLICSEFMFWKGCVFAAEAAVRVLRGCPDTVLDIYGAGPEEKNMRRILDLPGLSDRVIWHGFVGKADLLQALRNADVFLYPSYHHGLATVILQAMYCRLPIVALAGDPVAETVARGCGLVAHGNSREEIVADVAAKAEELVNRPDLRRQLGDCGRELVDTCYEWQVLTGRLAALYQTMLTTKDQLSCR